MHPVSMATDKAGRYQGDKVRAVARSRTWQLSGLGEKCTPPSPGPESWVSPGTCQERLRRRCAMGYAHS